MNVNLEELPVHSMVREYPVVVEIHEGDQVYRHLATNHEQFLKICLHTLRRRNNENRYGTIDMADERFRAEAERLEIAKNTGILAGITEEQIQELPTQNIRDAVQEAWDYAEAQERKNKSKHASDVGFLMQLHRTLSVSVQEAIQEKTLAPSGKRARHMVEDLIIERSIFHNEGFNVEKFDSYEGE